MAQDPIVGPELPAAQLAAEQAESAAKAQTGAFVESVMAPPTDEEKLAVLDFLERFGGSRESVERAYNLATYGQHNPSSKLAQLAAQPGAGLLEMGGQLASLVGADKASGYLRGVAAGAANPDVAETIPAQILRAAGQVPAYVAAGGAGAAVARAAGAGAAAGVTAGTGVLGGLASAGATAQALEHAKLDAGERFAYEATGGLIGAAAGMVGPIGRALRRIAVAEPAVATELLHLSALRELVGNQPTAWRTMKLIARDAGHGAAVMGAQHVLMNALVQHATDEDLDLFRGLGEATAVGAGLSTILGTASHLATWKRAAMAHEAAKAMLPFAEYRHRYNTDEAFRVQADFDMAERADRWMPPAEDLYQHDIDPADVDWMKVEAARARARHEELYGAPGVPPGLLPEGTVEEGLLAKPRGRPRKLDPNKVIDTTEPGDDYNPPGYPEPPPDTWVGKPGGKPPKAPKGRKADEVSEEEGGVAPDSPEPIEVLADEEPALGPEPGELPEMEPPVPEAARPGATLPPDLAGAKVSYGFPRNRNVAFESDVEKALYIVSGKNRSAQHDRYLEWLRSLGMSDERIEGAAKVVRSRLKKAAISAPYGDIELPLSKTEGVEYRPGYHGTPHRFAPEEGAPHGRFRDDKMGSGEGAQSYGWGHYIAGVRGVAQKYRKMLARHALSMKLYGHTNWGEVRAQETFSDKERAALDLLEPFSRQRGIPPNRAISGYAMRGDPALFGRYQDALGRLGSLYTVDIPTEDSNYLLWDEPFSKQTAAVQAALRRIATLTEAGTGYILDKLDSDKTGERIYRSISDHEGGQRFASATLREFGIRGIKYQDAFSRGGDPESATYNYVIFDPADIKIENVEYRRVGGGAEQPGIAVERLGSTELADGSTQHRYRFVTDAGDRVTAAVSVSKDGRTVYVDRLNSMGGENSVGVRAVRAFTDFLLREHGTAERIAWMRVGSTGGVRGRQVSHEVVRGGPHGQASPRQGPSPTPFRSTLSPASSQAGVVVGRHPSGAPLYQISYGLTGTYTNVIGAKTGVSVFDVQDILVRIAQKLGVTVGTQENPSLGQNGLGYYHPGGRVSIRQPGDVSSAAHEIGHAIHRVIMDEHFGAVPGGPGNPTGLAQLDPALQGEIRGLAYRGAAPGHELAEGLAELVRLWVTSPEELSQRAPRAAQWFEGWLLQRDRAVSSLLREARSLTEQYRFQGNDLRPVTTSPQSRLGRVLDFIKKIPRFIQEGVYDESYAANDIDSILRRAGAIGKRDHPARDLLRAHRGNAGGRTDSWLHGQPTDLNGNRVFTKNFNEVMAPIKASQDQLFERYIRALQTLALEPSGAETGMAPAEALVTIQQLDLTHPHFADVAADWTHFMDQFNSVLAKDSPIYAATLKKIEAHAAQNGITFWAPMRYSEATRGQLGTDVRRGDIGPRRRGDTRPTLPFREAVVHMLRERLESADMRHVVESMVALHDATQGILDPIIHEYSPDPGATPEQLKQTPLDISKPSFMDGVAAATDSGYMSIRVVDPNGRTRHFQIDPRHAKVFAAVDPNTLRVGMPALVGALTAPRRWLTVAQVGAWPAFQLFKNIVYDVPTLYTGSKYYSANPLHFLDLTRSLIANIFRSAIHEAFRQVGAGQRSPSQLGALHERLGLHATSGLYGELSVARTAREIGHGGRPRGQLERWAVRPWQVYVGMLSVPQRAVQLTHIERAAKAHKIDLTRRDLTAEEGDILRLAGRQPLDYNASGSWARTWARPWIPFFTAATEGPKYQAEAIARNPLQWALKTAMALGAIRGLYYLYGSGTDDDKSPEEKLRSISIPLNDEGLELNVPIASEYALPQALLILADEMVRGTPHDTWGEIRAAMQAYLPPAWDKNPVVATLLSQAFNRRGMWAGVINDEPAAPIVSDRMMELPGPQQATTSTAPMAMWAARAGDQVLSFLPPTHPLRQAVGSPLRWEAGLRSMLGGNAEFAAEGFGLVPFLSREKPYGRGEGFESGFSRRTTINSQPVRDVAEVLARLQMKHAALEKKSPEPPEDAVLRRALENYNAFLLQLRSLESLEAADGMTETGRVRLARLANQTAKMVLEDIRQKRLPVSWMGASGASTIPSRAVMLRVERGEFFR